LPGHHQAVFRHQTLKLKPDEVAPLETTETSLLQAKLLHLPYFCGEETCFGFSVLVGEGAKCSSALFQLPNEATPSQLPTQKMLELLKPLAD
jgi:hypothetical protein